MPTGVYDHSNRKTGKFINCKICGKRFWIEKTHFTHRKYCSYKCHWKSLKGKKQTKESIEKRIKANTGKKRSKEFCEKLKGNTRGFKKGHKGPMGKNHHNWKGGITPENKRIRKSIEYKEWREKVFKYDNYTCWICKQKGKKLHPHHLKTFANYPKLRFVVSNGLTLCEFCHKTYTKFGVNNN